MRIQSIEFKNFASYGNSIQKLEFEEGQFGIIPNTW